MTAIIQAVPAALAGIAALLASLRNGKRIQELHVQINSRMDKWLADARAAARAEGHSEGVRAEYNRRKGDPK
jgi:hypothetical protein